MSFVLFSYNLYLGGLFFGFSTEGG